MKILEHEILKALCTHGEFGIRSLGSQESGMKAIYYRQYGSADFDFGLLTDMVNNPRKYNPIFRIKTIQWDKEIRTVEQVNIGKFSWNQVADAVETLPQNGHVKDFVVRDDHQIPISRHVQLTNDGVVAFRNHHYLNINRLDNSIIKTNKLVRFYTLIIAISAVATIYDVVDRHYAMLRRSPTMQDTLQKRQIQFLDGSQPHRDNLYRAIDSLSK
jgi:hypothetical protein